MTSTIQSTVASALSANGLSQYNDHAKPVVDALTERDHQLVELIAARVSSQFGVSAETVQQELANIGMAVRPAPEPEPEAAPEPDLSEFENDVAEGKKGKKGKRLDAVEAKLDKLLEIASSRFGITL